MDDPSGSINASDRAKGLIDGVDEMDVANPPAVLSVHGSVTGAACSPSSGADVEMKNSEKVKPPEEPETPITPVTIEKQ